MQARQVQGRKQPDQAEGRVRVQRAGAKVLAMLCQQHSWQDAARLCAGTAGADATGSVQTAPSLLCSHMRGAGCSLSPRLSRTLAHLSPTNNDWPPFAGAASTSGQAGTGTAAAGEAGQQRVGGRRLAGWKAAKLTSPHSWRSQAHQAERWRDRG